MRFFFYGTLMDADVRRAVLGVRAVAPAEPAILEGWRRVKMAGVSYPVIVRARGQKVEGVLMHGVDGRGREMLQTYEGDEYAMIGVEVAAGDKRLEAKVFVPRPGLTVRVRGPWTLEAWQRRFKRRFLNGLQAQRGLPRAAASSL
jgi:Gamma-glutamyl cyclotransferase, AIG2-like